MPVVRGADRLRRSLLPSLLAARRANEALANPTIELFEIAKVYLPQEAALPQEPLMLSIVGGREYAELKGTVEAIVAELKIAEPVEAEDADLKGDRSDLCKAPSGPLRGKSDLSPFDPAHPAGCSSGAKRWATWAV